MGESALFCTFQTTSIIHGGSWSCVHHLFCHLVWQIPPFLSHTDFPSVASSPGMQAYFLLLLPLRTLSTFSGSQLIILHVVYHSILEIRSPMEGWVNYETNEI